MKIEEIRLLRENAGNGIHKPMAMKNILGIEVINTPVNVTEPDIHSPKHQITNKFITLVSAYLGRSICSVADVATICDDRPSRKPPIEIPPHLLAKHITSQFEGKAKTIDMYEHATIAFGISRSSHKPTIGISTLHARLPRKELTDSSFIKDMHAASGMGRKVAEIPDGVDLATGIALLLSMRKYRDHRYSDFVSQPAGFDEFIIRDPRYLHRRLEFFLELGRLKDNLIVFQQLSPYAIVMLLDSAVNMPGHMIASTWGKFVKKIK